MRFIKIDPATRYYGPGRTMELLGYHPAYSPNYHIEQIKTVVPQHTTYPPAETYDPRVHYTSDPPAYRQQPVVDHGFHQMSMPERFSIPRMAPRFTDAQEIDLAVEAVKNGEIAGAFPDPLDVPPQFPGVAVSADPYGDSWDDPDEWHDDPFLEPDPLMDSPLEQMVNGPMGFAEMDPMDDPIENPYAPMG